MLRLQGQVKKRFTAVCNKRVTENPCRRMLTEIYKQIIDCG